MIFVARHVEVQGSDKPILVIIGACKSMSETHYSIGEGRLTWRELLIGMLLIELDEIF